MLISQEAILNENDEGVAICGMHYGGDVIHVGLFWHSEGERKIVHFLNGANIPISDADNILFQSYFFNPVPDFKLPLLPTLSALCELISQNKLNGFIFNRVGVVYDGGKFEYLSGAYTAKTEAEKFVNCAVFVIALLNTFDYTLLNWATWPNVSSANRTFLDGWLDTNKIPVEQRESYYNQTKEMRGKHVIVCPNTQTKPSPYDEAQPLADELINNLTS